MTCMLNVPCTINRMHFDAACSFEAMTVQRCLFLNDYDISRCRLEIAVRRFGTCKRPMPSALLVTTVVSSDLGM